MQELILKLLSILFPPKLPVIPEAVNRFARYEPESEIEGCIVSVQEKPHRDAIDRHFAEQVNA